VDLIDFCRTNTPFPAPQLVDGFLVSCQRRDEVVAQQGLLVSISRLIQASRF
jgi:hypothetical protein